MMPKYFYTIGHSNRTLSEFLDILNAFKIKQIVDVRSIPQSRHVPWFNKNKLQVALKKKKIAYLHLAKLGGLRRTTINSLNLGWYNSSFRGFADYMQTPDFFQGLKMLNALIKRKIKVAIMCAEAVPWRCHRSLIADAEVIRHYIVFEIISKTSVRKHKLTSFAVIDRRKRPMRIIYPEIKS